VEEEKQISVITPNMAASLDKYPIEGVATLVK
jgi:hypothetical protein